MRLNSKKNKEMENENYTGSVIFYNDTRGFGFLKPDAGGDDLYLHVSNLKNCTTLYAGDRVSFTIGTHRNKPIALEISKL